MSDKLMAPNIHPDVSRPHDGVHKWESSCDFGPVCLPAGVPGSKPSSYDPPPPHYAGGNGLDNWAIWDAYDLDRYTANAVKYILRAGKKDIAPRLDDLKKARNYIMKAIELEERRDPPE